MNEKELELDGIELYGDEGITEETLKELSNNKGDED